MEFDKGSLLSGFASAPFLLSLLPSRLLLGSLPASLSGLTTVRESVPFYLLFLWLPYLLLVFSASSFRSTHTSNIHLTHLPPSHRRQNESSHTVSCLSISPIPLSPSWPRKVLQPFVVCPLLPLKVKYN